MTCPNCGANNIEGSSFCIKCGTKLKDLQQNPINEMPSKNIEQPMNNNQSGNVSTVPLNYLMYIVAILMNPIKGFKNEEDKLNNSKTSFLFALIVAGAMTIINLVRTMISVVRVSSYSWSDGYTYSWQWENLKNINYIQVIGKNFLIYIGIILTITVVFYIGSLIVKKQLNFIKTLSIATTSIIPAVIGLMILSPLGALIWSPLSIVFSGAGIVYSLIILYELINNELNLDGDMKVYFNLACFGILAVAGYYAYMKLFMSAVTDGLGDLLDLFK